MKRILVACVLVLSLATSGCTALFGGAGAGAGAGIGYALDSDSSNDGAQIGAMLGLFIGAAVGIIYDDKLWKKVKCKIAPPGTKDCPSKR